MQDGDSQSCHVCMRIGLPFYDRRVLAVVRPMNMNRMMMTWPVHRSSPVIQATVVPPDISNSLDRDLSKCLRAHKYSYIRLLAEPLSRQLSCDDGADHRTPPEHSFSFLSLPAANPTAWCHCFLWWLTRSHLSPLVHLVNRLVFQQVPVSGPFLSVATGPTMEPMTMIYCYLTNRSRRRQ